LTVEKAHYIIIELIFGSQSICNSDNLSFYDVNKFKLPEYASCNELSKLLGLSAQIMLRFFYK